MRQQTAEMLVSAGEDLGIECRVYEDYSGRGMYGKTTWAIVVPCQLSVVALAARAVQVAMGAGDEGDVDSIIEDVDRLSSDGMGRDSVIVY
jgi:hypothetical protein